MNINPVQGFKNLTPNQKKAAIAGAIGTAAVAATTILAYTQGKTAEVKGFKAIGAGYQKMGSFIAEKANEAWTAAKKAVDLGDDKDKMYEHWLNYGMAEGRNASTLMKDEVTFSAVYEGVDYSDVYDYKLLL